MNFSEFANILYPYCGDGCPTSEFVKTLVDNIMEVPRSDKDIKASYNDEYNPLALLQEDTLNRIYSIKNNYQISKKNISIIKGKLDKDRFTTYINEKPLDVQLEIAASMKKYIQNFDADEIGNSCAELFSQILGDIVPMNLSSSKTYEENMEPRKTLTEVPPTSVYYDKIENKIHIGKEIISIPKELQPPDDIAPKENIYVNKLHDAYSDAEKHITKDIINNLPKKYERNFKEQRKNYYSAEYIYHSIRDSFVDGDSQFNILKNDTYDYISITWQKDYKHGYDRLISVLEKVVDSYSTSVLSSIHNLISPKVKKGICHMLANDDEISWVLSDE